MELCNCLEVRNQKSFFLNPAHSVDAMACAIYLFRAHSARTTFSGAEQKRAPLSNSQKHSFEASHSFPPPHILRVSLVDTNRHRPFFAFGTHAKCTETGSQASTLPTTLKKNNLSKQAHTTHLMCNDGYHVQRHVSRTTVCIYARVCSICNSMHYTLHATVCITCHSVHYG